MDKILIYQITVKRKKKYFFFNDDINFYLHYRVDEDRFWFTKKEGKKIVNEFHTKNNLMNSLNILEQIHTRLVTFIDKRDNIDFFYLKDENLKLFNLVKQTSKNLENRGGRIHTEENKVKLEGMLLK